MLAGTYFVWCQEHRMCLGFSLMANHESPKTAFDVVYRRWKEPPSGRGSPWVPLPTCSTSARTLWPNGGERALTRAEFVYDNTCNAQAYILAREPVHFKDMRMYVDATHFRGHKNCSHAFNVAEYPARIMNSQLQEQKNSCMHHFKLQAMYLTQPNYLYLMRYLVYRINRRQKVINQGMTPLC